ncbi:MAG: GNAT family N-acetyltransferase [Oscillospiraceae bacterium]|nr:GNAT family N-acetyltransferase [Oscillospiraceae bacterium]
MIKAAQEAEFLAAVRGLPFFGGRQESVFRAYCRLPALARFYLVPGGALSVLCGGALLWCEPAAAKEAALFLQSCGAAEVLSNLDTLPLLGYDRKECWVMAFEGEAAPGALKALRPEELLSLFTDRRGEERDEALSDLSVRFARGGLELWGLYEGETLTAALAAETAAGECYLSFVRTRDGAQRKGYGGALLRRAAARYRGLPCYLLCEADKRPFYEKNGFFAAACQWRYQKRDEKRAARS